jgi:thymidylate synthase (FAD)
MNSKSNLQNKHIHRININELDKILGRKIKVLDDGFVRVIDYLGSDSAIVQAARVSYGIGTKRIHADRGLIRYLMRHRHTTPFEMCEIKLHLRVPMDCWRQWIRHRTASVNEYSTRYSVAIDSMQNTKLDEWRKQAIQNRQASEGYIKPEKGRILSLQESNLHKQMRNVYIDRLKKGVSREQARKDLPLSTYTEAYWKIDLHNLLHFLKLRMDLRAQHEIRSYARIIGEEIVRHWCPVTWEAFLDYQLNSLFFSANELTIINLLIAGDKDQAIRLSKKYSFVKFTNRKIIVSLEGQEFEEKLKRISMSSPYTGENQ